MADANKAQQEQVKKATIHYAMDWGKSPLPPTLLATLITALHARPLRPLPMLFPPVLLFSTYLNLSGFEIDSAGLTAAWSGLYLLLASRRKSSLSGIGRVTRKFGARGLTRGVAMGLAGVNLLGGGLAYALGNRKAEEEGRVSKF